MEETRLTKLELEGKVDFTRQRDFYNPLESKQKVTIVGCGGIGSPTALSLAKFGIPSITLVDYDEVEAHNLPNQLYPMNSIGKKKGAVLKAVCELFGTAEVKFVDGKIQDHPDELSGIVITGLDNMGTRLDVWNMIDATRVDLLIDGRIAGLNYQLYTIDPKNKEQVEDYERHALFPQAEMEEAPCTARAIIHVMWKMAADIQEQVWKHVSHRPTDPVIAVETEDYVQWLPYKNEEAAVE